MMKFILGMFLFICQIVAVAQDSLLLKINFLSFDKDSISYKTHFSSKDLLEKEIQHTIQSLEASSYLGAYVSVLEKDRNQYIATIHVGGSYQWLQLKNSNIPENWLEKLDIRWGPFNRQPILAKQWIQLKTRIIKYAQNHGYPFAQIKLDAIQNQQNLISGNLYLVKNTFFSFGNIIIHGDAGISSQYLEQYLDIHNEDVFDQRKVENISKMLGNLPFVSISQTAKIQFVENKANIHLYLKRKKLNRFDIIFGIAPNTNILDPRKIIFTGQGNMDLYNSFKHGERIQFAFEYIEKGTQSIDLKASYPYLFQLPFGGDVGFGLFKKDTTYFDVKYQLGLTYQITQNQNLKVFFENITSNLLNINQQNIIQTMQLPNVLDISKTSFGIRYQLLALDYNFNPRKGWDIQLQGSFGKKNIQKNHLITDLVNEKNPNFKFESLYDGVNLIQNQYQMSSSISYYLPLFKHSVLLSKFYIETIFSNDQLFDNEFLRIGGASSLRGFNEDQFIGSLYTSVTLEYRWILQKNAHFFLFTDTGYIEKEDRNLKSFHRPIGLGAGIRFETKAGIFGLSTAIGRDFANVDSFFDLRSPKIHFGFLSIF